MRKTILAAAAIAAFLSIGTPANHANAMTVASPATLGFAADTRPVQQVRWWRHHHRVWRHRYWGWRPYYYPRPYYYYPRYYYPRPWIGYYRPWGPCCWGGWHRRWYW